MSTALILQHGEWGPPGVLGDWASERGFDLVVHRADLGEPLPELNGQAFVASLGSPHNPEDTQVQTVADELRFLDQCVARGTPVLGLCFGGQMLAKVLGGSIGPAAEPELGWHAIESTTPELVPAGPWLQWHYDAFTLPPGAEQYAASPAGIQAFTHGPHLGVQFHPESTIEIVAEWARHDGERIKTLGIDDGEALLEAGRDHAGAAVRSAYDLFDAFWQRAQS